MWKVMGSSGFCITSKFLQTNAVFPRRLTMSELIGFFEALLSPDFPFVRHAFFAGVLSSVLFGVLGSVVTVKRIAGLAGAISHAVLGGIGISLYLSATGLVPNLSPMAGAIVFALLSALVIGTVSLTGLGLSFGYIILKVVGEGQLYLGGLMVMLMSIVLGMGVPGVAAYVIVSTVSVPVLIQTGAIPMAAHMFCLIYACLSNITPPVAMSSYVASGIADSDQTKTSLIAVKLGLTGFILPFFFLDNPILLLGSTEGVPLLITIRALITSSIGVIALSSGLQGYLLGKLNILERLVMIAAGLLFIETGLVTDLAALMLVGVILTFQYVQTKSHKKEKIA
jgi:TRAP-type uncharacterized transport system fused permease subunit